MWAFRGCRGTAPFILNLGTRWNLVVNITPRPLYSLSPIAHEADWAPEVVWTFCRRHKLSCPHWDSKPWPSSPQPSRYSTIFRLTLKISVGRLRKMGTNFRRGNVKFLYGESSPVICTAPSLEPNRVLKKNHPNFPSKNWSRIPLSQLPTPSVR